MSDVDELQNDKDTVLLAEDDPVSAAFLVEALRSLDLEVTACTDGKQALQLARTRPFGLLLFDCRLPGMGAREILAHLHADETAASRHAPAIATSADMTTELERTLRACGCRTVLGKPLQLADLEQALRTCRAPQGDTLIDDASGLDASGGATNLKALRGLFMTELDTLSTELAALGEDPPVLRERLHRLRASCGFCGATALASASERLGIEIGAPAQDREKALDAFRAVLEATRDALGASLTSRDA